MLLFFGKISPLNCFYFWRAVRPSLHLPVNQRYQQVLGERSRRPVQADRRLGFVRVRTLAPDGVSPVGLPGTA